MVNIPKQTWRILKDQNKARTVCCRGSAFFYAGYLRSASRYPMSPGTGNAGSGFRLCFFVE